MFTIDKKTKFLIHQMRSQDTLEALALHYGVSMFDIKTHNRGIQSNCLFLAKTLVIPTTQEKYQNYLESQKQAKIQDQKQLTSLVLRFCTETGASEEVASSYLLQTTNDLERAIQKYTIDAIQKQSRPKRRSSGANSEESPRPEETSGLLSASQGYYHNSFGTRSSVTRRLSGEKPPPKPITGFQEGITGSHEPLTAMKENFEPTVQIAMKPSKRAQERLAESYNSLYDL